MATDVLDRLREMFGIEATDADGVFDALERYDAANLRVVSAHYELLKSFRGDLGDSVMVLLGELADRERLAFGAPLPETISVTTAFAQLLAVGDGAERHE